MSKMNLSDYNAERGPGNLSLERLLKPHIDKELRYRVALQAAKVGGAAVAVLDRLRASLKSIRRDHDIEVSDWFREQQGVARVDTQQAKSEKRL